MRSTVRTAAAEILLADRPVLQVYCRNIRSAVCLTSLPTNVAKLPSTNPLVRLLR